ncbi:MAG: hypothetical protein IID40_11555 [Planctomycetes bacterium]|nr:hypothetical protein [Planctomycetota bacterium]
MPTPDRTTVKATARALMTQLRSALRADPPTSSKPFRRIEEGAAGFGDYPRPFLTVSLVETRPLGTTEGDKIVGVTLAMRLVTDVVSDDPHDAILDAVAAVDDFFDDLLLNEATVVVGAEGFDDRVWGFGYPKGAAGVQAAEASCRQSFVVKVARGAN